MHLHFYSSDKIVKIALGEHQLNGFYIVAKAFVGVLYFQHQKIGRRYDLTFFEFLLRFLPVSHYVPDHLVLIDRGLGKFLVLEIHYFEESEVLWVQSLVIYSELFHYLNLYISESVI